MKYVYLFNEGNKDMKSILGGKGANLAEMTNMGLPVPFGLTVTTEACTSYYKNKGLTEKVKTEIFDNLKKVEVRTEKKFGDPAAPLLVSVRSGAPVSMPGMMDTILNVGLTDEVAEAMAKDDDSKKFIYDSYRRLIMMFANVVKGTSREKFDDLVKEKLDKNKVSSTLDLPSDEVYDLFLLTKKLYKDILKEDFPSDPIDQLIQAIEAVFKSWNNDRAKVYRKLNHIDDDLGTAVNVQEMVYGNLNDNSLTGVTFTRNPSTGENVLFGEYLDKAQGEDIVSGVRTPKAISLLKEERPEIYKELQELAKKLEAHYKDMQDIEFTVENNKLYMLQTRSGKRTSLAAIKIVVSMVKEKLINEKEALLRIDPERLNDLLHPVFDDAILSKAKPVGKGLPASPGAAYGEVYFTSSDAAKAYDGGKRPILVREETAAEDVAGMSQSYGVLTVRGGMTSHAAVVARGLGRCCITGCSDAKVDLENKTLSINGTIFKEGDKISLDGSTGNIYEGWIETKEAEITGDFETFMDYAKRYKKIAVRANAETVGDVTEAVKLGAEGIGLCRTEHMFFKKDKILSMRKLIIAENEEERSEAIQELLPIQRDDFVEIFGAVESKPIVIRYLDPPLHEFLPKSEEDIKDLAEKTGKSVEHIHEVIDELKEFNPMMGLRGCRLAIVYPAVIVMQTRAILEAYVASAARGRTPKLELMIPLVSDVEEYKYLKGLVFGTKEEVEKEFHKKINVKFGAMLETPRGLISTGEMCKAGADFFSFGTNDLTQLVYGLSRDDSEKFLPAYYKKGIFASDPFKTIDRYGVGRLMVVGTKLARNNNKKVEIGVCGEHGGDPKSIEFFDSIGVDYVSCSPYRIPIAILAAARAALKEKN